MQVATRQGPAYGVARLTLAPNEPVRVESGAMMAMSAGVTPNELIGWIQSFVGTSNSGTGLGGIGGGLFGRD